MKESISVELHMGFDESSDSELACQWQIASDPADDRLMRVNEWWRGSSSDNKQTLVAYGQAEWK